MGKRRRVGQRKQRRPARTAARAVRARDWSYAEQRQMLDQLADHIGEYQGIPVPVDGQHVRLCDGHPLQGFYEKPPPQVQVLIGGPPSDVDYAGMTTEELLDHASDQWLSERVVNEWYDPKHNRDVFIFQRDDGRAFSMTAPRPPDQAMARLTLAMMTLGASDGWSVEAEATAQEKLATHVSERQLRHYLLTGMFMETSRRSGLTYLFRRSRPTVVLTPRWPWYRPARDQMRVLAVLCLHPIGFYDRTWAGCMTPTDDVIAHLLMMRGDEAGFWRHANQHDPAAPEAGL